MHIPYTKTTKDSNGRRSYTAYTLTMSLYLFLLTMLRLLQVGEQGCVGFRCVSVQHHSILTAARQTPKGSHIARLSGAVRRSVVPTRARHRLGEPSLDSPTHPQLLTMDLNRALLAQVKSADVEKRGVASPNRDERRFDCPWV